MYRGYKRDMNNENTLHSIGVGSRQVSLTMVLNVTVGKLPKPLSHLHMVCLGLLMK